MLDYVWTVTCLFKTLSEARFLLVALKYGSLEEGGRDGGTRGRGEGRSGEGMMDFIWSLFVEPELG